MTKEELEKFYYWDIKMFYENGALPGGLAELLKTVYDDGYSDGKGDND